MPLGVAQWLRGGASGGLFPPRMRKGLWAGRRVGVGNRVSNDYGKKSRRVWMPNVVRAPLYSEALGQKVRLKVTAAALR